MLMWICTPTYEFCLVLIVPFLLVLPKLSVHSLACDESSHISETERLISGCQDLHSCTRTFTRKFSNIDIFLRLLLLKVGELVMSEM